MTFSIIIFSNWRVAQGGVFEPFVPSTSNKILQISETLTKGHVSSTMVLTRNIFVGTEYCKGVAHRILVKTSEMIFPKRYFYATLLSLPDPTLKTNNFSLSPSRLSLEFNTLQGQWNGEWGCSFLFCWVVAGLVMPGNLETSYLL
ncbi:hypothetical protein ACOSQ2_029434 [Xanthoceras sorbifolium]